MSKILIISFLNAVIFGLYCYYVCNVILQKKETNIKKIIYASIPFLIIYYCILCLLDSIYSIFFSGLWSFMFIKIIFQEKNFMALFLSGIIHTIKILIKIIVISILNSNTLLLINTYKTLDWNAFYINLITLIISALLILIFRKQIRKFVKFVSSLKKRQIFLLIAIYMNFIITIIYQPPYNVCSLQIITDFIIIFSVTGIGIFNISSEMKMEALTMHYKEIFEYSKTNGKLLNSYKMQVHENKNRLLMIKGMLDGPKKEIEKYIDELLKEIKDNKNSNNYWLPELRYIPLAGVRNFINYKLTKLKELGAEIEIFVSSELEKLDPSSLTEKEYNQLSTILGVILDNMIESIKETDEKLISINMYVEDNAIHCEYVNSFSGNIDLTRLNEVGYTTKGEQHGVGLPLVAKITKANNRFECNPKIIDNFFIQHLVIKLYDKSNLQKISKN